MNFFKTLLLISCVTLAITLKVPKQGQNHQARAISQSWCYQGTCWGYLHNQFQCQTGFSQGHSASCSSNEDCKGAIICSDSGQETVRGWCADGYCYGYDENQEDCQAGVDSHTTLECGDDYECFDVRYCVY